MHTNNRVPKLYRQAYDVLVRDIRSGAYQRGMRLSETQIAERFSISRAPARQALQELERDGLVRKAEGRGYEISDCDRLGNSQLLAELPLAEVEPRSSWELIYPEVELEIVSRTALASWRINEAILAKHYGVSRTVARDVVARLQERGIVRKDQSARWYAQALTRDHIEELYELRWVLEPLALQKAAQRLPSEHFTLLRQHLEQALDASQVPSETLDRLEQELHVDLLSHCGNQALLRAVSLPQALLVAHHFLYRQTSDMFASEPFLPEHLTIIQNLEQGHIAMACDALVHHLQVSRQRVMLRIEAVANSITPAALPYLEQL
ncbi:GntR family transcriptional regulator [Rhizobium lemnae]|uniref:GntR family transcriptional regulator n=1 Tax=Rhizobium lemnae TaxID=1214924 RepID=A0ABV8EE48_9HYPH|nr:GntR family transcriptional regulator [Rhizobium lemnae]MCJ8508952.1 GntR family transcriptional regulator [Rhizobium lemnae]